MTAKTESEPVLLREDRDGIARLTLNRPRQINALSVELLDALQAALDDIAGDDSIRVVVIGANGKGFCAGHDMKEMREHEDVAYFSALFAKSGRIMIAMTEMPQPIIARVHGIATAAGCQLVANCDLAVASEAAQFATNGISNGLFCSTPAVPLSRNVTRKHAFEMLFTGDFIDAKTALDYGIVNRVVPASELDAAVADFADSIKAKSRATVTSGKRMFYAQLGKPLDEAYTYAAEVMAHDMMKADAAEGLDAFLGKRKPVWKHK